ncbi:MAG: 4Fe-4S binding protein [Phycisphaerae bacterium]|nr:4Fe-4S binding protein [Phycisphaerae bacterium]
MAASKHGCSKVAVSLPIVNGGAAGGAATGAGANSRGADSGSGSHAGAPRVRASKSTKWRFLALFAVQALMILHLLQWLWSGETLTPVEPSEGMEFVKRGVLNAGAVLFAIALLSTVIFGRWFCGWGCHILLLQDGCAWILKKLGLRPRAFRSRLLVWVPLGLGLYMFVWPLAYRWAIAPYTRPRLAPWVATNEFTTEHFWASFPGVLMAIPFLVVCGFATIYFLGQKGYCTYACPYGGFFAPLDRFSRMRIRVTDACEHCGHCTAVCTSNVRVHEEVARFGMVVDPGCMKCLDCVSVCPNDALHVGWGAPAAGAAGKPHAVVGPPGHRHELNEHAPELSLREEVAVLAIGVVTILALNAPFMPSLPLRLFPADGIKVSLPLLFASGIAAITAFLAWKAWRLLRRSNEGFHSIVLRRAGRITAAGWSWLLLAGAALVLVAGVGAQNAALAVAVLADRSINASASKVFSRSGMLPSPEELVVIERADRAYEFASLIGRGGIGFVPSVQPSIDVRRSYLAATRRDFVGCEQFLRAAWNAWPDEVPFRPELAADISRALWARGDLEAMDAWHAEQIAAHPASTHPHWSAFHRDRIAVAQADEDVPRQIEAARSWLAWDPSSLEAMRHLSLALVQHGEGPQIDEGIALVHRTLEIEPGNAGAWRAIATGEARAGRLEDSVRALRASLELAPDDWRSWQSLGDLLRALGRDEDAAQALSESTRLRDLELARPRPE